MNNPFKVGDVVHHSRFGQGIAGKHYSSSGNYQKVTFPLEGLQDCHLANLSFSPWPAPNHTRPFEPTLKKGDEIYIRPGSTYNGDPRVIVVVRETEHYVESTTVRYLKSHNTFHRIGEEIKFN